MKIETFFSETQNKTKQAGRKAREQIPTCHIEYLDQNNSSYLVLPASLSCLYKVEGDCFLHRPLL